MNLWIQTKNSPVRENFLKPFALKMLSQIKRWQGAFGDSPEQAKGLLLQQPLYCSKSIEKCFNGNYKTLHLRVHTDVIMF